jgi:hypothetical protein
MADDGSARSQNTLWLAEAPWVDIRQLLAFLAANVFQWTSLPQCPSQA